MKKFYILLSVVFFAFPASDSLFQTNSSGAAAAKPKIELVLGNPSGAANWVTWHLSKSDIGDVDRTNAFAPDTDLPKDFWIRPADFVGSGYDKGHLCPSKDRSSTEEANRETFLMSNMQPQAPKLNQKTWKYLEDYTRDLAKTNEEYIYAGCYGDAGRIKDKITIPTNCYKIIVVLPEGENDLKRINRKTRIIAVNMPNDATVSSRWRTYLTTVDDIGVAIATEKFPTMLTKQVLS